jgi:hypothetical protein
VTKRDWDKADERLPDPGRVREVRESGVWIGNDRHPFETEGQRAARYAENRKAAKKARQEKASEAFKSRYSNLTGKGLFARVKPPTD